MIYVLRRGDPYVYRLAQHTKIPRYRVPQQRRIRTIDQIAALPYRTDADGRTQVLLITSRETGRWVVPKGNPMKGFAPHEAAAQEAFEEAGLRGIADPSPIGAFRYTKRRRLGEDRELSVTVYPFAVTAQADDWPERLQRQTRWFPQSEASAAVDEPALKALIANFRGG